MKIILFANTAWYLFNHRLALAKAVRDFGADVRLLSPRDKYAEQLESEGFRWTELYLDRKSTNPITDLMSLVHIARIYRELKPDLVHNFTLKPVLYGSLAALGRRVPAVVNSITGVGYFFSTPGDMLDLKRALVRPLLRIAMNTGSRMTIFQHQGDLSTYERLGLVSVSKASIIPGSGIDVSKYHPRPEPKEPVVVMIAGRMLWDKGIEALIEAGRILRAQGATARIVLAGKPDPGNPQSIPESQLEKWDRDKEAEWWGFRADMPNVYAQSHIVALPTTYGEGVPKVLLEAAAMGKPLIASNLAGCREVITHGENGFLVPAGDARALAEAISSLVHDRNLRQKMGEKGRDIVLERFTNEIINERTIQVYQELLGERNGLAD